MAQAPIMPVFAADLISDTTHLSAEEFGVYVLLLAATWLNNGKLLDDDKRLALIARIGIRKWRLKMRPALAPLFNISGGLWRQQRLEKEWNRVNATLTSRRTSAQRAGNASATRRQPPIPIPIKEASLPLKDSESRSDSESDAAREGSEGKKNQPMNPEGGRCAPLGGSFGGRCHPEPGPDAVPVSHRTARPRSPPEPFAVAVRADKSAAPVRISSPAQPVGGTNDADTSLPSPVADSNRLDSEDQGRDNPLIGEASDPSNRFGALRQGYGFSPVQAASRTTLGAVAVLRRPPRCTKSPALKAKIRALWIEKLRRYVKARKPAREMDVFIAAACLSNDDPQAQRVFEGIDLDMRAERWDDMREWKRQNRIAA